MLCVPTKKAKVDPWIESPGGLVCRAWWPKVGMQKRGVLLWLLSIVVVGTALCVAFRFSVVLFVDVLVALASRLVIVFVVESVLSENALAGLVKCFEGERRF